MVFQERFVLTNLTMWGTIGDLGFSVLSCVCESCYSQGCWFLQAVYVSCIPESWLSGNSIFVGRITVVQLCVG